MKLELLDLFVKTAHIMESDFSWEEKYDLIFSEEISKRVFAITPNSWYDPDTTYQEDVEAFYDQFKEQVKREI